jgi:hypothetical protein
MHAPVRIYGGTEWDGHASDRARSLACFALRRGARDGGEQERGGEERPDGGVVEMAASY